MMGASTNETIVIHAKPIPTVALAATVLVGWFVIAIGLLVDQRTEPVLLALMTLLFLGLAMAFISHGVRDQRYPELLRTEQDSLSIRHSFDGSRRITFDRSSIASFETEETVDGKGLILVFKAETTAPSFEQGCWSWVNQNRACCWFSYAKNDLGVFAKRLNQWLAKGDERP